MDIRLLNEQEILPALHLVWEVFAQDVAPAYPPEGVAQFQRFIKYDHIIQLYRKQEMYFFGAFQDGELCGTIAVKNSGHVSLFFIKKEWQGQGIGRMLFQAMHDFCAIQLRVSRLTVNAAPNAVAVYQRLGMYQTKEEQMADGIRFVPMEKCVIPGPEAASVQKKSNKKLVAVLVAAGIILAVVLIAAGIFLIHKTYQGIAQNRVEEDEDREEFFPDDDDPMNPDAGFGQNRGQGEDGETTDGEETGIASVPTYEAKNLSYEIKDESYTYNGDNEKKTQIYFDVAYPQLSGLQGKAAGKVNELIKSCAMQSVTEMYESPSEEFKEKMLVEQSPVLISYVQYQVCYANNDFISIAFNDAGMAGNQNETFQHLRCLNINLKDGTNYEAKDVFRLDDDFIQEWKKVMRSEASDEQFLTELTDEQIKSTLAGEDIGGNYVVQFFVDADGIEIGYDFNFDAASGQTGSFDWVTAPFAFEEIRPYEKNSDMWELLG